MTTKLLLKLVHAVEALSEHVEDLGCTCVDTETRNSYHAPNRRRRDSRCTGVALAVEYRPLLQRARRQIRRMEKASKP